MLKLLLPFIVNLFLVAITCIGQDQKLNVTKDGPLPLKPSSQVADPIANFGRLINGSWQVTAQSGTSMFHTWHWGPNKRSLRRITDGSGADGSPWRELNVVYWHPGRKEVCVLGLSPFARGVSEGKIQFDGETADGVFDLYQEGGRHRKMGLRWAFEGLDKYHDILLEEAGSEGLQPLVEFEHVRSKAPHTTELQTDEPTRPPSTLPKVFQSLMEQTWESNGEWLTGVSNQTKSTFQWIPYADAVYLRSMSMTLEGESTHTLDAYFYRHTGTGQLRSLALTNAGGVYEGELKVIEADSIEIELIGYEGDRVVRRIARCDYKMDSDLRSRVWNLEGNSRTLIHDSIHKKLQPKRN